MTEGHRNPMESNERAILTDRFITAWVNFCMSTATLQSNEKSFQAWFASCLIQHFGLARVYREVHLDKPQMIARFNPPGLMILFPELYRTVKAGKNELLPDVCVTRLPSLDTRHTSNRSKNAQDFSWIISEIVVITELKVATTTKHATGTQYGKVYEDILKLGLIMNAANHNSEVPLFFACVLDNLARAQPEDHVQSKFINPLLKDAKDWPTDWRKPSVLITAPIRFGSEAKWYCYLVDGASNWQESRLIAQFPGQFPVQPENHASPSMELPKPDSKSGKSPMSESALLEKSCDRCKEFYSGLKNLAQSEAFGRSAFTKSGYTLRYSNGATPSHVLLLRPDCLSMGFGPSNPPGFLNEKTNADFWSRLAVIAAVKGKWSKKCPELNLDDESWSHEDVATFLSALGQLKNQS